MGMVVRTNMAGLNANNALNRASKTQQNAMQKLASGFRINKAGDDASGLTISENMKNQIKALDTAADNCEDGANMIQTAEGYMDEVHSMLNRMTELAEKAANGVLDQTDRDALQDEMNELCGEIDRIATTANFNNKKILDGSIGSTEKLSIASNQDTKDWTITAPDINADDVKGMKLQIGESSTKADTLEVKINSFHTDVLFSKIADDKVQNLTHNSTDDDPDEAAVFTLVADYNDKRCTSYEAAVSIDISSSQEVASVAADVIRQVSVYVSDERGRLGAQQNRLEHTVNNLTTASENITAANSRIRDTNMAEEMMDYTSKNVIAQAAQAMLAQANSQPQNVLSLLQ